MTKTKNKNIKIAQSQVAELGVANVENFDIELQGTAALALVNEQTKQAAQQKAAEDAKRKAAEDAKRKAAEDAKQKAAKQKAADDAAAKQKKADDAAKQQGATKPTPEQPRIPVPTQAAIPSQGSSGPLNVGEIVKLLRRIADCVCSGKAITPPVNQAKTNQGQPLTRQEFSAVQTDLIQQPTGFELSEDQDKFFGDLLAKQPQAAAKQPQAAAKQQAAKDTGGLPQTAGGNAFVPDVDETGQAVSRTELTPEEEKIITRYLQDQEKETGKTAGRLGLRGKNDLGNLGVSADGSKDAAVDKFVKDRNLGSGGVDGKGFRKGSQPDPARLAERDAAVLGTTNKDSTSQDRFPIAGVAGGTEEPVQPNVNQATAKQQAASDTAGPLTKRDAQRARSEARLNNPKASEGSQQAARRSLRDLDRKEREENPETALNPKKGETLTPEMKERRRDAQISRSEKRLADGNLSEGGARAARTAKRDAERTKREANPATALNNEKGADVSTDLKTKRRNAARQRYQDRLNDPTASAGKKSAARRGLRDLDRKENPLPTGNSESDRQARRDAQISRSDKRIADGNLSEGGAQAARRAKRDAERGNREADPNTALNPKSGETLTPLMKQRRRDAQTQRSTARLNDPTSSEGTRLAARNALGLTREEAQAQGKLPPGVTGSLGTQEGIYQGKPPSSIKKPDNLTFNQQLPTSKPSAGQQTTGPVQIQGAAELNQSLTQMTQVSQQLNAAADKLTNLPALEITINGKIAPVEVILNGTQMLADFKDSFSKELMPLIAEEIKRQKLQLGS